MSGVIPFGKVKDKRERKKKDFTLPSAAKGITARIVFLAPFFLKFLLLFLVIFISSGSNIQGFINALISMFIVPHLMSKLH